MSSDVLASVVIGGSLLDKREAVSGSGMEMSELF
jgi:hypothetical protein